MTACDIVCVDTLIAGPTVPALDLEEVKKARRFSSTTLDTLFDLWIAAATQYYESETGWQLIDALYEYSMDAFPGQPEIELPHLPLLEIVSVKYDAGGEEVTFDAANYRMTPAEGIPTKRGRVSLLSGCSWPTADIEPGAVRIRYRAGFGSTPGSVPELVRYALHTLVGHFHRYGESVQDAKNALTVLPMGADQVMRTARFQALSTLKPTRSTWQV